MVGLGNKSAYLSISKKSLLSFQAEKRDGLWTIRGSVTSVFDANAALSDRKATLTAHLRSCGFGSASLSVSVPDSFARVALLDFKELPPSEQEARDIVLWRAAREAFMRPEECIADHQVLSVDGGVKVLAVLSKKESLGVIDAAAEGAGMKIARVSVHSLNLVNLLTQLPRVKDHSAVITAFGGCVTIMFFNKGGLVLYRHLELEDGFDRVFSELTATYRHYTGRNRNVELEGVYVFSDSDAASDAASSVFSGMKPERIRPEDLIRDAPGVGTLEDKMAVMSALGSLP